MRKFIIMAAVLMAISPSAFAQSTSKAISNATGTGIGISQNTITTSTTANSQLNAKIDNSNRGVVAGGASVNVTGAASGASGSLAASGPCIGESFQAGAQAFFVGANASYISESKKCNDRELIRLGMAFPDADVQARAKSAILGMFNDQFGAPQQQPKQTASLPVAPAPVQTASAAPVAPLAKCVGQNPNTGWYQANCH